MKPKIIRYGTCTLALLIASTTVSSATNAHDGLVLDVRPVIRVNQTTDNDTWGEDEDIWDFLDSDIVSRDDEDIWDFLGPDVQGHRDAWDDGWWMLDFETARRR